MNKLEIARLVLNNHRESPVDSHRLQAAGQYIELAIQEILSYRNDWPFMQKTAMILTEADESNYALPLDVQRIHSMGYNDEEIHPINPERYQKFIRYYDNSSTNRASQTKTVATVMELTQSPFANLGYVMPVYGAKTVLGVGTAFDTRVVGRFFKTTRDDQLIRIKAYTDATHIELSSEYNGRSLAGTVNIFDDNLERVVGSPHVTNFKEDMIGKRIQIGSATDTNVIESVDEITQVVMLYNDTKSGAGEDLRFSVQDTYEIDPPGIKVLKVYSAPSEDDKVLTVDYYAGYTPLAGWYSVPVIPQNYHAAIVHLATLIYGSMEGSDASDKNTHQSSYNNILLNMLGLSDPFDETYPYGVEPDPVRHETLRED